MILIIGNLYFQLHASGTNGAWVKKWQMEISWCPLSDLAFSTQTIYSDRGLLLAFIDLPDSDADVFNSSS